MSGFGALRNRYMSRAGMSDLDGGVASRFRSPRPVGRGTVVICSNTLID